MDPDATLEELLSIAAPDDDTDVDVAAQLDRAVELIEALDGWLCKGGALPERWLRAQAFESCS